MFGITCKDLPVDEKYPKSCVYWIYHEDLHTDPRDSGYVGVSVKGFEHRFKTHNWEANKGSELAVHRAIRKYGQKIKILALVTANPEMCLLVEEMLRPSPGIGYNIAKGGGGSPTLGMTLSDETKSKISASCKGEKSTLFGKPRAKAVVDKMVQWYATHAHRNTGVSPWRAFKANKEVWSNAILVKDYLVCNPTHGIRKLSTHFGVPDSVYTTVFRKIRLGWNPLEDQEYNSWLTEYKQKETADAVA